MVRYLAGERVAGLPIHHILAVSRWQAKAWSEHFGIPPERFIITRNGVDLNLFAQEVPRDRYKLVYASRPDRGLEVMLNLWPYIRADVPDARLHIFTYRLPDDSEDLPIAASLDQPGIVVGGSLSKRDLAHELLSARLLTYPATFKETSCMAAIEAMAAGTPVVTSSLAAIPETVPDGIAGHIVPGDPHSADFGRRFVQTVVRLIRDDATWTELSEGARQYAHTHHNWQTIAREWVDKLKLEPDYRGKNHEHEI
jgi:glycosyltransferase involved in cell wall biosynthesis